MALLNRHQKETTSLAAFHPVAGGRIESSDLLEYANESSPDGQFLKSQQPAVVRLFIRAPKTYEPFLNLIFSAALTGKWDSLANS
jgi:hypothetical protein